MSDWLPMATAPVDGTAVLLLLKNPIPHTREDLQRWAGLAFVGRNNGDMSEWGFAAPVGHGGFPSGWMVGWMPLPAESGAVVETGHGTVSHPATEDTDPLPIASPSLRERGNSSSRAYRSSSQEGSDPQYSHSAGKEG